MKSSLYNLYARLINLFYNLLKQVNGQMKMSKLGYIIIYLFI